MSTLTATSKPDKRLQNFSLDHSVVDFPFTLRHSQRAKRLAINVSPEKGVELVCPRRTSARAATKFLQQQRAWVLKNKHVWQLEKENLQLPEKIQLTALDQVWPVQYETQLSDIVRPRLLQRPDNSLVYWGQRDTAIVCALLRKWCHAQAKQHLQLRLRQWSAYSGLRYHRLSLRAQRTRWGSCSSERNISLNYKLIFMPQAAVDYVLLHELAHTEHMNHSPAFWNLVARFLPDYRDRQRLLRKSQLQIPHWYRTS